MARMTRRERLTAIIRGEPADRPAVKLWRAAPWPRVLHPAYQPVREAAVRLTDLMVEVRTPFHPFCGPNWSDRTETFKQPTDSPQWVERVTTLETPLGTLRSIHTDSTTGHPGYQKEYLLKEPEDIRRILSIPYEPYPFDPANWQKADEAVGDGGIALWGIDHAMYALERQIGSENFALWSFDAEDLLLEAMTTFAERIRGHVQAILDAGHRPIFGWVGPELCIPPLMSVDHFRRYVYELDKPLIDLMHEAGCGVWVHCHGKMAAVIELFAEMGVDTLNPVEPPPMGDLTLEQAFEKVGGRMALEGNLETHDLMTADEAAIRAKVDELLEIGAKPGRRHILCNSSGYMEDPDPPERLIRNLMTYVEHGVERAETYA